MRTGIVVLNIAALVWLAAAFGALDLPLRAFALPFVISALVAAIGLRHARFGKATPSGMAREVGRKVGLWSTIEGIVIAISVFVLVRIRQPELIAPVVAGIVGLHFIPLARSLGLPVYYWSAAGLVLVGAAALALPFRPTLGTAGIGAAAVLYATSLSLRPPASPASPRR